MGRRKRTVQLIKDIPRFDELDENGKLIVEILFEKFDDFTEKFEEMLAERDKKINLLEKEIAIVKKTMSNFEEKCDEAESSERRNDLILSGQDIPATKVGENCVQVASVIFKEKLNIVTDPKNIIQASRIGRKPINQTTDKRSILVKLGNNDLKVDVLKSCKTVKPQGLYINENLIQKRGTILYGLRTAKKKFPDVVASCASRNMKVFAYVKPPKPEIPEARNSRIPINTMQQLEDFSQKFLKVPFLTVIDDPEKFRIN